MTRDEFLQRIDAYLHEVGMSPTRFGIEAMRDPAFVPKLRNGRDPTTRTVTRCEAFMADHLPTGG